MIRTGTAVAHVDVVGATRGTLRCLSLVASLVGLAACGQIGAAMGNKLTAEGTDTVDTVPLSKDSILDAQQPAAQQSFAQIKKVAVISQSVRTSTPFVDAVGFGYGSAYGRVYASLGKALAKHGIELVPLDTVIADPVHKEYDTKAALAAYSGKLFKAAVKDVEHYAQSAATAGMSNAVSSALGNSQLAKQAGDRVADTVFSAVDDAADKAADQAGGAVADFTLNHIRQNGGDPDKLLIYLPAGKMDKAIENRSLLAYKPTKWASEEAPDPYVARLAKSLGVDAIIFSELPICWDASTASVGMCANMLSTLVFYDANGQVMHTPFFRTEDSDPRSHGYGTNPDDKKKRDEPAATPLWAGVQLTGAEATEMQQAEAAYRAICFQALDDLKKQASGGKMSMTDALRFAKVYGKLQNFMNLYVAWKPSEAQFGHVDEVFDRVVTAVLKPMGR